MPRNVDISEIYSATVELFCERGFGGTTTKEIAERAGVNEVTLFRRFGSKAALMEAAISDTLSKAPFAQVSASDDVVIDLRKVVEGYLATFETHSGLALTLFSQVPRQPELRGVTPVLMQNMQSVARIVATHQAKGRIRPGDPIRFTIDLIAPLAITGFVKEMGIGPGHAGLDVGEYVRTYLAGHGAAPET
ncbi:TetR/AcrR family transcriptional regulator [Roseibium sp.]|uniref:TetR/AcrR family transcriptional regulator n=1 Tax=Roseibium sp. TaxID=1936156 RepID=UPI003D098C04